MANKLKVSFLGLGLALISQSIQGKINFSYSLDLKKNAKELGTKIQSMPSKNFRKDVSKNLADVNKLGRIVQMMNNLQDDEKNEFQQYCESVALSLTKHAKRSNGKRVFNKSSQYYKGFVNSVTSSSNVEQSLLHNALSTLSNDNKEQTFLLSFADIVHQDLVRSTLDFTGNMQEKLSLKDDGAIALSGGKYFTTSKDENNLVTIVGKKGDDNFTEIDGNNAIDIYIAPSKTDEDNYKIVQSVTLKSKHQKTRLMVTHAKGTNLDFTVNNANQNPVFITNPSKCVTGGYMGSFLPSDSMSNSCDENPKLYKIKLLQETQEEWKKRLSSLKDTGTKNNNEDDNDALLEDNLQCSEGLGACFNFLHRRIHMASSAGKIKEKCGEKFMPGSELMLVEGTPVLRRLPAGCQISCATAAYLISNAGFTNSCAPENLGIPIICHNDVNATDNKPYIYVMDKAFACYGYLNPAPLNIGTFNVSYGCYGEKREANTKFGLNLLAADDSKRELTGTLSNGWTQTYPNSLTNSDDRLYVGLDSNSTIHAININSITATNLTGHKVMIKSGSNPTDNLTVLPSNGAPITLDDTLGNYIKTNSSNEETKSTYATFSIKNGSSHNHTLGGTAISNGHTSSTATKLIFGNGVTSRFIIMGNSTTTASPYSYLAVNNSTTAGTTHGIFTSTVVGAITNGTSVVSGTEYPCTFLTIN